MNRVVGAYAARPRMNSQRATDAPDVIERRLAKARDELGQYGIYQYLIVNDELPRAYDRLRAIYLAAQSNIDRVGFVAEALVREAEHRSLWGPNVVPSREVTRAVSAR